MVPVSPACTVAETSGSPFLASVSRPARVAFCPKTMDSGMAINMARRVVLILFINKCNVVVIGLWGQAITRTV